MEPSTLTIIILILAVISFLLEKIPVNMTVMLTLVGDAAVNVLIGDQIKELGQPFGFFEISKIGIPLTIIMLAYMYFIGYKFLPDIKEYQDDNQIFSAKARGDVPRWKQVASVVILFAVFIGMIFEDRTGIPSYMVAIMGAVADVLLGIFTEQQAYQLVSIKTVILLGGMTPLATALKNTGAAQIMADTLIRIIGGSTNVYYITIIIFILTCVMTQFMSNVVTITLLMPIIIAIAETIGVFPSALLMVLCIASTMSILSPIACPPANLIYAYGGYRFPDYLKSNIGMTLVFLVACILMIPLIWPLYI